MAPGGARWLLLIHQLPPSPAYLRVKIGRHLQRIGAVAIKNSVYALPSNEEAREDLDWVLREIGAGGGDGSIVEASFVDGLSDEQVRELFRAARDADYDEIAKEVRSLARRARDDDARGKLERLRRRVREVADLDFFDARRRLPLEGLLSELSERLAPDATAAVARGSPAPRPSGATWVTRSGIHVDRMASAWLIRRFIDPRARFRFVSAKSHQQRKGELRFDMFDGEFTHEGDLCTFEVLLDRFELSDPALRRIAEIVHDIDLKDDKHGRPEKAGVEQLVQGIAAAHDGDEERLARASAALDDLYESYRRK